MSPRCAPFAHSTSTLMGTSLCGRGPMCQVTGPLYCSRACHWPRRRRIGRSGDSSPPTRRTTRSPHRRAQGKLSTAFLSAGRRATSLRMAVVGIGAAPCLRKYAPDPPRTRIGWATRGSAYRSSGFDSVFSWVIEDLFWLGEGSPLQLPKCTLKSKASSHQFCRKAGMGMGMLKAVAAPPIPFWHVSGGNVQPVPLPWQPAAQNI